MFDLKSGVHFHEIVFVGVEVKDELNGPCIIVSDCSCCLHCGVADHASDVIGHVGWGFFDYLLVSALDGAISLVEVDVVAVLVAENLNLDVSRLCDVFLDQNTVIGKGLQCLTFAALQGLHEILPSSHDSHALAPTA
jgi:hypothetical protein